MQTNQQRKIPTLSKQCTDQVHHTALVSHAAKCIDLLFYEV